MTMVSKKARTWMTIVAHTGAGGPQSTSWEAAPKRREIQAVCLQMCARMGDSQAGFGVHDHDTGRSTDLWRTKTL